MLLSEQDVAVVNTELEQLGFNIGVRLIDEFLVTARLRVIVCLNCGIVIVSCFVILFSVRGCVRACVRVMLACKFCYPLGRRPAVRACLVILFAFIQELPPMFRLTRVWSHAIASEKQRTELPRCIHTDACVCNMRVCQHSSFSRCI